MHFKVGQLVLSSNPRQFIPVTVTGFRTIIDPCDTCSIGEHVTVFVTVATHDGQSTEVQEWQLQEIG